MISAASSLHVQGLGDAALHADYLAPDQSQRRALSRRQTYAAQLAGYGLGTMVLLLYVHAGTITLAIPSAYFVAGASLVGMSACLSQTRLNDRLRDHFVAVAQVIAHVALQLGFLQAAPVIGYAFLDMLFVIFGVAALRMTPRQATLAWTLTAIGVCAIFLNSAIPIGLPAATASERLAAAMCFVVMIGQCAFLGLYGDALRRKLYRRGVELSEAYQRIEQLAELDELTGTFNRRCIMRMLQDEIVRARRGNTACSIALLDLDWFKRVNDAYGHPAGDEVLRTFAISIFANIRQVDKFGRYGGEEFLLVLPDTAEDVAARILDRLRRIIGDLDWSAFSQSMQVTISVGVAQLRPDETADGLLARADRALYKAKAEGRDRIAIA
jgi:diguanylate cyclase (GGDEF)-like protein